VLGLLALGADRFIIGPPATAGADEYSVSPDEAEPQVQAAPAAVTEAPNPAGGSDAVSVGQRLRRFEGDGVDEELTDLFQLPPGWRPEQTPVVSPVRPSFLSPAELFKRRKLNGVLVETTGLGRRQAIVDGHAILLGQTLDGFRLIEVTHKTAVFEGDGRQVVLQVVEQPAVKGTVAGVN